MQIANIFDIDNINGIPVQQVKTVTGSRACIVRNLPDEIYHAQSQFWGSSMLRLLYKNSIEFKAGKTKVTKPMELGTAFHCFLLEEHRFYKEYAIYDENERRDKTKGMTAKDNIAWKAEFYEENKKVTTREQIEAFEQMRFIMLNWRKNGRHPIAEILNNSESELSIFIENFEGLPVKIRIDMLVEKLGWLGDLKTTSDASNEAFYYKIKDMGYDAQLFFYKDVYEAIYGENKISKVFILASETSAPYCSNLFNLREWEDSGRLGYMMMIDKAKSVLSYDGYFDTIPDGEYFNIIKCTEYDRKRWVK